MANGTPPPARKRPFPLLLLGLPFGALCSILALIGRYSTVAVASYNDIAFHFLTNLIIYTLVASALIALVRQIYLYITRKP